MITVTAAIIKSGGKYLITQRSAAGKLPLKWEFPGGKVEPGETPEQCLEREIKEELNLNISVGDLFAVSMVKSSSLEIKLLAYHATIIGGAVALRVHNDARWVLANQLHEYDFCPADIAIIQKLNQTKLADR